MATSRLTRAECSLRRLEVRHKYEQLLADHDHSEASTRVLRAIAVHDCELTALLEGNKEAKDLMQMRTLQISMLLTREPVGAGASVFDQLLLKAKQRTDANLANSPARAVDTSPRAVVQEETPPVRRPGCAPTEAQATLLRIVPRPPSVREIDDSETLARRTLTEYAKAPRAGKEAIPDTVVDAARVLVKFKYKLTEICRLGDVSRMGLHRRGVRGLS